MNKVVVVIPARFASTRLPGKPLVDILGKPMIQHVYERACQVPDVAAIVVATDDERVAEVVRGFGGRCLLTSTEHPSGTDRLVEVMEREDADLYVNLQGDEPLIRPDDVRLLIHGMRADTQIQVGTLCHDLPASEAGNPNHVKIVLANNGDALYFSRSPVPFPRDEKEARYLKHVGVYGYRREVLQAYGALPQSMPEMAESLEQLRLMSAGLRIRAFKVEPTGPGVDTHACLQIVRSMMGHVESSVAAIPSLADVQLVITDVDGVLTDGGIFYNETGECLKRFHVRDGLGIRMLVESGVRVAVLSGRDSTSLRKRVFDLGLDLCSFGAKDKAAACNDLMRLAGVSSQQTVCIGDDSIDLPAFAVCGLSYAVGDAPAYVKMLATGVLERAGGQGAFRELSDAILRAKGKAHVFETADGYRQVMARVHQ